MIKKLFFQLFIVITCLGTMSCTEDKDGEWEYFHDDLVDVSELPVWMQPGIDDFTKQHPTGVDVYQGEYNGGDIYIIMTIAYNTPYVYDNNGNYIGLTKEIKEKSAKWKRIYSWRPTDWNQDCETNMSISRFFNQLFYEENNPMEGSNIINGKGEFHANRPFVYVIQEWSSGAIFFIGTFQGNQ